MSVDQAEYMPLVQPETISHHTEVETDYRSDSNHSLHKRPVNLECIPGAACNVSKIVSADSGDAAKHNN